VGIATGPLIVGEFGCEQRTDYTVMGPAANLGARICSTSQPGEVLICPTTYDHVRPYVKAQPRANRRFKGFDQEMTVYNITEVTA
jgi:class 3 adenylate cyclase